MTIKSNHKMVYLSHPSKNKLPTMIPNSYIDATRHELSIEFSDLLGMWKTVRRLKRYIERREYESVVFFATGGIPYMIPTLQLLGKEEYGHMFPGLAWSGKTCEKSGKEYFATKVKKLLANRLNSYDCNILFVDTTNSGNAVNNILQVIEQLHQNSSNIETDVIGIVNAAENKKQNPPLNSHIEVRRCCKDNAQIIKPSGWTSPATMNNFKPEQFCKNGMTVNVQYWVVDKIPTEDTAALLGAKGIHDLLEVQPQNRAGRILVQYPCGGTKPLGSGNAPRSNLMNLLSSTKTSAPWKALQTGPSIQQQILGIDGMRIFELSRSDEKCPGSVKEDLLSGKYLLSAEEVYYLLKNYGICKCILNKVIPSVEKSPIPYVMKFACDEALPDVAREIAPKTYDKWINWFERQVGNNC